MSVYLSIHHFGLPSLLLLASLSGTIGCQTILGIEKGELSDNNDSPNGTPDDWGPGLRFSPDTCGTNINADEALIRGCMLRVSCDPLVPAFNVSDCISFGFQGLSSGERCGLRAENCSEIQECIHRRLADTDQQAICNSGNVWECDPGTGEAIHCTEFPYIHDCNELGATCSPHNSTDYQFAWGCSTEPAPNCVGAIDGEFYCQGTVVYTCVNGAAQGINCATLGTICTEDSPGTGFCNDRSTQCDDRGTLICEGDAMKICDTAGNFVSYDCGAVGLNCRAIGTSEGFCEAEDCREDDCTEGCVDDSTMRVCVGGATVELDCEEYGFNRCIEGELFNNTPFAFCL